MTPTEETPIVDDLAPVPESELILESDEQKDEDEEGGDGEGGKKSGGGGKKPAIHATELLQDEENLGDYDSETLIEKLKMLVWAPFSTMVPGASSFESEQDLKRILFLGQIGLITNQIHPADIADPDLIKKLEQRHQMRQEIFRAEIAAATSGSAAGLAAGLVATTPPPQAQQKREQKQQVAQVREASTDSRYQADDKKPEAEQKTQPAKAAEEKLPEESLSYADEQEAKQREKPSALGIDDVMDIIDTQNKNQDAVLDSSTTRLDTLAAISGLFNAFAQQTEYTAPEQKIEFRFADPAPKMEVGGSMGGL